ncbi:MAG: PEP-CTERM sorting domain-containing protein [Phycisphaerales bacterium]
MNTRSAQFVAISSLIAATCGSVFAADTIRATFNSVSPGVGCEFSTDSGNSWTGTIAGSMNWTRDIGNPGTYAGLQGNFSTFCIEVTQHVGFGGTYDYFQNTVANGPYPADINFNLPMGGTKAGQLAELFGRQYNTLATNTDFGAFQMAVWEIVYDNGSDVNSGVFQIRNAATEQALANTWLSSIDGSGPIMGGLFALSSAEAQDQIVPGPGSFALAGFGGLVAARRRRSPEKVPA